MPRTGGATISEYSGRHVTTFAGCHEVGSPAEHRRSPTPIWIPAAIQSAAVETTIPDMCGLMNTAQPPSHSALHLRKTSHEFLQLCRGIFAYHLRSQDLFQLLPQLVSLARPRTASSQSSPQQGGNPTQSNAPVIKKPAARWRFHPIHCTRPDSCNFRQLKGVVKKGHSPVDIAILMVFCFTIPSSTCKHSEL